MREKVKEEAALSSSEAIWLQQKKNSRSSSLSLLTRGALLCFQCRKRAGEIPISSAQHFSKTHLDPKSNGWKREIITIIWFAIYVNIQHVNSNSRDHLKFSQQCRRFGYMFRLIKSSFSSTLFGCVVTFLLFFSRFLLAFASVQRRHGAVSAYQRDQTHSLRKEWKSTINSSVVA